MKLKIKKLHPAAITPTYGTPGAACFDLYAMTVDGFAMTGSTVWNGYPATCDTGLAFEIPEGHVMLIFSRSGHGFKNDIRLANCTGVIDSDYRGSVQVKLTSDRQDDGESAPFVVKPGDRIAQAMVIPVPTVEFVVADELSTTERGAGGFGSTGTGAQIPTSEAAFMQQLAPVFTRETNGLPNSSPREISDREWAAQSAGLREGCTVHVPGVGDL